MKIILLIRSLTTGGTETQVANLALGLAKRGENVKVLVFYGGGRTYDYLREAGIEVIDLRKSGRSDVMIFLHRLYRVFRKEDPDVAYGFLTEANLCLLLCRFFQRRLKIVWGIRAAIEDTEIRQDDLLVKLGFRLARYYSRIPDLIISNSKPSKTLHLEKGFVGNNYKVVPNGINVSQFKIDKHSGKLLRKNWLVSDDEKLVGIVARLDPIKNHLDFLQAASLLRNWRTDVKFVCVGNGEIEYAKYLRDQAKELSVEQVIIWAGQRSDMSEVYNALDINTLCSRSESFPNSIMESTACGIPCVITDVCDRMVMNLFATRIVPRGKPIALAEAWNEILNRETTELSNELVRVRERMVKQFDEKVMVGKTLELLKCVCE